MCRKCFLKRKKAKLSKGKINFFAHELLKGHGIPLFSYSPNNYAIEGRVWQIERKRTKHLIFQFGIVIFTNHLKPN